MSIEDLPSAPGPKPDATDGTVTAQRGSLPIAVLGLLLLLVLIATNMNC